MKYLLFFLSLCLIFTPGIAQNPGWIIPPNYWSGSGSLQALPIPTYFCDSPFLNDPNDPSDGYDGQLPEFSSNMVVDPQGEIEFFIVDGHIYDGKGNFIAYMDTGGGLVMGASETVIVPDPVNCNRYYIIATQVLNSGQYSQKLPFVFLLDMSIANTYCGGCDLYGGLIPFTTPLGQVFALPIEDLAPNFAQDKPKVSNAFIAASNLRPDNSRFVFISIGHAVYRFKIDSGGFTYDNYIIPFGPYSYNPLRTRSEMELVDLPNGNYRLAVTYRPSNVIINGYSVWEFLYVVDLDPNGNIVGNTEKRFPMYRVTTTNTINISASIKGVEFTEDGSRLYVTHTTNSVQSYAMEYYDFGTGQIGLAPFQVNPNIDTRFSMLELTDNDRLILANENGLYELPNASSATANNLVPYIPFNYLPTNEGLTFPEDFRKMYMLPDQIDGMDYDEFMVADLACCINYSAFDVDTFEATSGVWSPNSGFGSNPLITGSGQDAYIKKEIRIPAGTSLFISNLNLHFAPGARLVIENGTGGQQGGKLTLNNTKLTLDDRCQGAGMWLGVEVWGNSTDPQGSIYNSSQGRLIMENNSKIEHALVGVLLGKRVSTITGQGPCSPIYTPQPGTFDFSRDGGIIQARDSRFLQNQVGVWFLQYLNPNGADNVSNFTETSFIWNGLLKDNLDLGIHASLNLVKGVKFTGCAFQNLAPSLFPYDKAGTGIRSIQSQFYVDEYCSSTPPIGSPCPNPNPSKFDNLTYGIGTFNSNNLTFSVDRSSFYNNQYGIITFGTKLSKITRNKFSIPQASYQAAGCAMNNTETFTIQENQFSGLGSFLVSNSYGVGIFSSGIINNDIYKNTFTNLNIGGQAQGINAVEITGTNYPGATGFNMSGLNWTCNEFYSYMATADLAVVDGRIDLFQGFNLGHPTYNDAVLGSARNRFSLHNESPNLEHDIKVSGTPKQAILYTGLNTPHYSVDSYTPPNWVAPAISSYNGFYAAANSKMCPSKLTISFEGKRVKRDKLLNEITGLKNQLEKVMTGTKDERIELQKEILFKEEQLDHLETQMTSDLLLTYDDLETITAALEQLGKVDIKSNLLATFSQDLELLSLERDLPEPEAFLPLDPNQLPNMVATDLQSLEEGLKIFPNPTSGQVHLDFSGADKGKLQVDVFDSQGKLVIHRTFNQPGLETIELDHLRTGMYLFIVKDEKEVVGSRKIEVIR